MAANLIALPFRPAINLRGGIEPGAILEVYATGTLTPVLIYSDVNLTTELSNPLTADGFGAFPSVYYDSDLTVRLILKQANGTVLSDTDPYVGDQDVASLAAQRALVAQTASEAAQAAAELAETGAESARDLALAYGSATIYATWTELAAATGMSAGDVAQVVSSDTGTHTDPVVGGTVANSGVFQYSASPAGWERIADLESDVASSLADAAAASAAEAEGSIDNNRLVNAIALISQARSFDAAALEIPARDGTFGTMIDLNPTVETYTQGPFNVPVSSAIKCVRDSTGVAIGGGETETFAANVPRIIGSKIFKDAGGTNVVTDPTDFSAAGWTKTNFGTPSLVTGPGGADGAYSLRETTTNAAHQLTRLVSGVASFTQITCHWLVKPEGRDFLQWGFFNASTSKNTVARGDLTTGQLINAYPAQTGGQTALDAGMHDYGDGWWLLWLTATFSAGETGFRPYLNTMSNSTTVNFAGETDKGVDVAAVWAVTGVALPVNFLTGTRAAETLSLPLARGAYIEQTSDGVASSFGAFLLSTSGYRALTFPSDAPWVTRYRLYPCDAFDIMDRANTSDGSLGTASDGGAYSLFNGFVSAYPLPTATTGRITSNWATITPASGSTGVLYAVRDLGGPVRFGSARVRFGAAVSGGGSLSNTSIALLTSNDIDELVAVMPVHLVLTRSGVNIQKREEGGAFIDLGFIGARIMPNNSEYLFSFEIHGQTMRVTLGNQSVVVSDPDIADAARYMCWEIFTSSNNTTDNAQFKDAFASRSPVGDPPTYTAAAPVVTDPAFTAPSSPATFTSGTTLSVVSQVALVNSNAGPVTITARQWERNGVAIPGATGTTHVTTAGTDAGATFRCAITYTNSAGSTVAYSTTTPALA
jgi:hypothetical protein